jgi:hypothetical protein
MMPGEPLVPPPPYGNPPLIPQPYPGAPDGFSDQPGVSQELWRAGLIGGPDGVLRRGEELVQQHGLDQMRLAGRYADGDAAEQVHRNHQTPRPSTGSSSYSSSGGSWAAESEGPYRDPSPPETHSAGGGVFILLVTAIFCAIPWWVYLGTNTGDGIVHVFWAFWSIIAIPTLLWGAWAGVYEISKAVDQANLK